jgi:hypothetical protein
MLGCAAAREAFMKIEAEVYDELARHAQNARHIQVSAAQQM